jgi:hypothetical protein
MSSDFQNTFPSKTATTLLPHPQIATPSLTVQLFNRSHLAKILQQITSISTSTFNNIPPSISRAFCTAEYVIGKLNVIWKNREALKRKIECQTHKFHDLTRKLQDLTLTDTNIALKSVQQLNKDKRAARDKYLEAQSPLMKKLQYLQKERGEVQISLDNFKDHVEFINKTLAKLRALLDALPSMSFLKVPTKFNDKKKLLSFLRTARTQLNELSDKNIFTKKSLIEERNRLVTEYNNLQKQDFFMFVPHLTVLDFTSKAIYNKLEAFEIYPYILSLYEMVETGLINEEDIKDVVTLEPFENPYTLQCGHTFSFSSLFSVPGVYVLRHELFNKCPCCRNQITSCAPNIFLNALSSLFKDNTWKEEVKTFKALRESIKVFDSQINAIEEESDRHRKLDGLLYHLLQSPIFKDLSDGCFENGRTLQQKLTDLEDEIDATQTSLQLLQMECDALSPIGQQSLENRANTLLRNYQNGDLNSIISMNLAKKNYTDKLQRKLTVIKSNLEKVNFLFAQYQKKIVFYLLYGEAVSPFFDKNVKH